MSVSYRKLTKKDLDTFIEMRIAQLREEGGKGGYRPPACAEGSLYPSPGRRYLCFVACSGRRKHHRHKRYVNS